MTTSKGSKRCMALVREHKPRDVGRYGQLGIMSLFLFLQSLFYRLLTARVKERLKAILFAELEFCRNQFFLVLGSSQFGRHSLSRK